MNRISALFISLVALWLEILSYMGIKKLRTQLYESICTVTATSNNLIIVLLGEVKLNYKG